MVVLLIPVTIWRHASAATMASSCRRRRRAPATQRHSTATIGPGCFLSLSIPRRHSAADVLLHAGRPARLSPLAHACYLPSRDVVTAAASLESRGERLAWFAAKDQMRATIHMRQFDCGAATAEVELGQIEVCGLPWSILKHIRQAVLPLWNEGGCLQPGPAAVVVCESLMGIGRILIEKLTYQIFYPNSFPPQH